MNRDKCFLCHNYRNCKIKQNLFMYSFPRSSPEIYGKWLKVSAINEVFEKSHSPKVCHHCFMESDFEELQFGKKKRKLKKGSVPRMSQNNRKRPNEVSIPTLFTVFYLWFNNFFYILGGKANATIEGQNTFMRSFGARTGIFFYYYINQ